MMKSYILHLLLHHLQPVITDIERPIILIHWSLEKFFQIHHGWRKNYGSINKIASSDIITASLKVLILKEYRKNNTNNFFHWNLVFGFQFMDTGLSYCAMCTLCTADDTWFDWQEIDQVEQAMRSCRQSFALSALPGTETPPLLAEIGQKYSLSYEWCNQLSTLLCFWVLVSPMSKDNISDWH